MAYGPVGRQRRRNKQRDNCQCYVTAQHIGNSIGAAARQRPARNNGRNVGSSVFYENGKRCQTTTGEDTAD
jgi:hypothetical protein